MKINPLFLIGGIVLILLTGIGAKKVYNMTRGLKNNNPGNIRHSNSKWQGASPEKTDASFVTFLTPEFGIRALAVLVKNYMLKQKIDTVTGIISRWAPSSENNTTAYINSVAKKTGFKPDEKLTPTPDTLVKLAKAIIHHENGIQPYSDETIKKAVGLV